MLSPTVLNNSEAIPHSADVIPRCIEQPLMYRTTSTVLNRRYMGRPERIAKNWRLPKKLSVTKSCRSEKVINTDKKMSAISYLTRPSVAQVDCLLVNFQIKIQGKYCLPVSKSE